MFGERSESASEFAKAKQECERRQHCMFQGSTEEIKCGSKQRLLPHSPITKPTNRRSFRWRFFFMLQEALRPNGDPALKIPMNHVVIEKTPVSPKHAPSEVTEYVPDIVAPEIVPAKLPISGELQLTLFPETVQPVMVEVEKQGEPLIVMVPEKGVSD